jgi:hypothetical protein
MRDRTLQVSEPLKFSTLQIKYNALQDVVIIEGIEYSGQLFREFGEILEEGATFRLVRRETTSAGTKRLWIERV